MNLRLSDKKILKISSFSYLGVLLIMGIVFAVATHYHIPFSIITGDPMASKNPFIGIVSNIGILLWCATATTCLFSSILLGYKKNRKKSLYLLASGIITALLLFDDLFMVHESIMPKIGLSENVMYIMYAIIFPCYFLYFKTQILKAENKILLILAFLFLGGSVGLDLIFENVGVQYFFEDGLKFFGIVSWFLFYTTSCFFAIRKQMELKA